MAFSVLQPSFDGSVVSATGLAGLQSSGSLGGGVYSIDASNFFANFADLNNGFPSDVTSALVHGFAQPNPAIQILTYQFHYIGQPDSVLLGAQYVASNDNSVLGQLIAGFNDLGGGAFSGTVTPGAYLLFSGEDLSADPNTGALPTALPLVLTAGGTFTGFAPAPVPEPSSALIIAAAAVVFLIARLPIFAGLRSTRSAA